MVGNGPRSFKKKIIFTSPTKSTMSSLPLNCVVASFPLAALHSSEFSNSTKAYLQMWVLGPFRILKLDRENDPHLISLVDLTAFLGVLTNLISE